MRARVFACVSIAALSGLCQCSLLFDLGALDQTGGGVLGSDDAGDAVSEPDAGDESVLVAAADASDAAAEADAGPATADAADSTTPPPDAADSFVPGPDVADVVAEVLRDAPADAPADVARDAHPDVGTPFDAASCSSFLLAPSTTVTASSFRSSNYANQAVDKDFTTRWESTQQNDLTPPALLPAQWIYLDFRAPVFITDVQIDWQNACAQTYELQVSNDATNWTSIPGGSVINSKGTVGPPTDWSMAADTPNLAGVGRYLRVYMTARCVLAYGYSMWEMRVYGHGVNSCDGGT